MEGTSSISTQSTPKKRIALTGASGYLGQHLLHHWMMEEDTDDNSVQVQTNDNIDRIWEVFALYSSSSGFEQLVTSYDHHQQGGVREDGLRRRNNVQVFVESLDLTDDPVSIEHWITSHLPLDVCIHTAAISNPGLCEERPEHAHEVNVPKHFLQTLANHSIPIVALSTDQVFDGTKPTSDSSNTADPSSFYTELDPPNPINEYGKSKVALEDFLKNVCPLSHVSLRSSIILGRLAPFGDQAHSTFLHFCTSRANQETDFFTDECRTVVSLRNVVEVLHYFVQHPPNAATSGIYHMGGRDRVSRYDMAKYTFEHFGFDTAFLKPTVKANQPPGKVRSPLDISMDSSKLGRLLEKASWHGIHEILDDSFPRRKSTGLTTSSVEA